MNAWLIYDTYEAGRNRHYIDFYFEECRKRHIILNLLIAENLTLSVLDSKPVLLFNGKCLERPDFAICRTINPMLSLHMEQMGIPVFNNSTVSSICNDKMKTYASVASLGVPVLDTFYMAPLTPDASFPLVIKPVDGKGGKNVSLLSSYEDYLSVRTKLSGSRYLIQKPSSTIGKDLRVYVIGKEIVTAILRTSPDHFCSNYCLGGEASLYPLRTEEKDLIQTIINHFDFGFVGIDFLFDHGTLVFNEIEDVVGARMVYAKTQIPIVARYLDFILSQL